MGWTRTTSPAGVDFIKHCEGLRLKAYPDNGVAIGYGTHRPWFTLSTTCTQEEAEAWFFEDLRDRERYLPQEFTADPGQGAFDAMMSWLYEFNRALHGSTLAKKYNAGDIQGAWDELPKWVKVLNPQTGKKVTDHGLQKRRWTEQAMWLGQDWQDYQARNYPALVYVVG